MRCFNQYGYIKFSRPNLHFIRSPTNTATSNWAVPIYTSSDRQPIRLHQIQPSQFTLHPIANQYGYTKLSRLSLHFIRSPTNMATSNWAVSIYDSSDRQPIWLHQIQPSQFALHPIARQTNEYWNYSRNTKNGLESSGIKFEQTSREVCSLIQKIFRMKTVGNKRAEQIISTLKGHQQPISC